MRVKAVRPWAASVGRTPASGPMVGVGVAGGAPAESAARKSPGPTQRKEAAGRKLHAARPLHGLGPRSWHWLSKAEPSPESRDYCQALRV